MTNGGPGSATEVPAKFIVDNLFERQNIGLATAASTSLLLMLLAVVAPGGWCGRIRDGGGPRDGRAAPYRPDRVP